MSKPAYLYIIITDQIFPVTALPSETPVPPTGAPKLQVLEPPMVEEDDTS